MLKVIHDKCETLKLHYFNKTNVVYKMKMNSIKSKHFHKSIRNDNNFITNFVDHLQLFFFF